MEVKMTRIKAQVVPTASHQTEISSSATPAVTRVTTHLVSELFRTAERAAPTARRERTRKKMKKTMICLSTMNSCFSTCREKSWRKESTERTEPSRG